MEQRLGFYRSAVQLLWPRVCAHCRQDLPAAADEPLCGSCRQGLPRCLPPYCLRCAEAVPAGRTRCVRCEPRLFACSTIRAAFSYRAAAVSLVHAFKFRGQRAAARTAGVWMAETLPDLPELGRPDALVPMPLHARRRRERGYNQARLIAEGLAPAAGAAVEELVFRRRETRPLWALSREDRLKAVEGAFACPPDAPIAGRRLWIIDDVCTSGASLEACAKALLGAGAASVAGFVFARQAQPLVQ